MNNRRVVIVGAGMAGLTAARRLVGSHDVIVVDKGRGVGGRLATRRIEAATFDHGAQFLTTHTAEFADDVARWVDAGVVTPWFRGRIGPHGATDGDGHVRFRGTASMNAIAKHLAIDLDVRTATLLTSVRRRAATWTLTVEDGSTLEADAVIMTAPVPQTLALLSNGDVELDRDDSDALHRIAYDPCLAVMATLEGPSGLAAPGAADPADGPIDWIADNHLKGISATPAVTIHATAEFSRSRWDATDDEVLEELLAAASLDPRARPGAMSIQRWRYARPSVEHPTRCLTIDGDAPLVCAGDAFGGAKVEGAALSGAAAADAILRALSEA